MGVCSGVAPSGVVYTDGGVPEDDDVRANIAGGAKKSSDVEMAGGVVRLPVSSCGLDAASSNPMPIGDEEMVVTSFGGMTGMTTEGDIGLDCG